MAYATLGVNERIIIQTTWNEKDLIKQVPGTKWDPEAKLWSIRLSWAACVQLRAVFQEQLTISDELNQWAWNVRTGRVEPSLALRGVFEDYRPDELDGLYDFQRAGVDWLELAGDALLADEMGTGKTVQALHALVNLPTGLPALVVCPNSVKTHWASEATQWLGQHITPYVIGGSAIQRKKIIAAARLDPTALVIVNYESMRLLSRLAPYGSLRLAKCRQCDKAHGEELVTTARCEVHPRELTGFPFRTVIIDEAHRIKDPKSKQTRAVWAMAHQSSVTTHWALTGTPIGNNPADLWSIMHAVCKVEYPSKIAFVDRYCLMAWNNFGGLDVVGINPSTREEFHTILNPRLRRMLKAIVAPQLPPRVRTIRHVEMTLKQQRAYHEIKKSSYTDVDGEYLITTNSLEITLRLMQLASSWVDVELTPEGKQVVTLRDPSPKLDELEVILEELGTEQVVVAAESRQLIMLAAKRLDKLKIPYGLIVGGTSDIERQDAIRRLNSGHVRCILFTVKAGGTGTNLQAAPNLINLQRSWSMIDNVQTENRVHRIGSEVHSQVNVIDIVAKGTIEERQLLAIHEKLNRLDEITRDRAALQSYGSYDTIELDNEETAILNSYALDYAA